MNPSSPRSSWHTDKGLFVSIDASLVTVRAVQVLLSRGQARRPRGGDGRGRAPAGARRAAAVPVMLCTGRGEALDEADRAGVQAQAYLPKPFSPPGLRELVMRLAGG